MLAAWRSGGRGWGSLIIVVVVVVNFTKFRRLLGNCSIRSLSNSIDSKPPFDGDDSPFPSKYYSIYYIIVYYIV